jgi:hypothetical protein
MSEPLNTTEVRARIESIPPTWATTFEQLRKDARALCEEVDLLRQFARSIRDNWDCDEDAHRYNTPCRCCDAEALVGPKP